ncbi:MAG TPA: 2OG-Fe(II) oxygenase [Alphaproteobacteria bacterium]|nr:2OG-Fe(II) oxygenase [Alphaproteobacteria bacterium]
MASSSASLDGDTAAPDDLFLSGAAQRLRAGDRFPNFILADQDGVFRSFVQRGRGLAQLIVLDPGDAFVDALAGLAGALVAAELECLGIAGAVRPFAGATLLADPAGKIRPALRAMSGCGNRDSAGFLLDRNQRLLALAPEGIAAGDLAAWALAEWLKRRQDEPAHLLGQVAPILTVPNVLSRAQCAALIERWHTHGHEAGLVSSLVQGEQVRRVYDDMKRRTDHRITDPAVGRPLTTLVARRLGPELDKAFHFRNYRFDRMVVVCYDSERGDYFRRHRDNQTPENANRRFALTVNLNSDEYEGGELTFPEYGPYRYKPPAGGAVVFSCSLLHEALPVTRGRRFALLSFLRDVDGPADSAG